MTSKHGLFLALGLVMGLALSFNSAEAGNRPTADNGFLMLNGEATRDLNASGGGLADGGGLTLITLDAGIGCNLVATGGVYEMHCDSAGHFCSWSDGGCSNAIGSQAYGRPVNASTPTSPAPYFFMTQTDTTNTTKQVCVTPASGDATMTCALFRLR
jgi:hypothetical protein